MEEPNAAQTLCLRLARSRGESALKALREFRLLDRSFKVSRDSDQLLIAILRSPSEAELSALKEQIGEFQIVTAAPARVPSRPRTIFEALKDRLPPHQLASLPRSIDIIGDVAIVEIPEELRGSETLLGKAILETNRSLRTVLGKAGPISTEKRVRPYHVIGGSNITETTHTEYGSIFHLDIAKVYFSPRLSFEHERVASQVRENEIVVDMFAGVGPFAIHIAKKRKAAHVYAIDVSEDAVRYLQENILLNRVNDVVTAIKGDARLIIQNRLAGKLDRVIMNLPAQAVSYVDAACLGIRPEGGIVHYYTFAEDPNPLERANKEFLEALLKTGRKPEKDVSSRVVKGTSPHEWQVAIDCFIK